MSKYWKDNAYTTLFHVKSWIVDLKVLLSGARQENHIKYLKFKINTLSCLNVFNPYSDIADAFVCMEKSRSVGMIDHNSHPYTDVQISILWLQNQWFPPYT